MKSFTCDSIRKSICFCDISSKLNFAFFYCLSLQFFQTDSVVLAKQPLILCALLNEIMGPGENTVLHICKVSLTCVHLQTLISAKYLYFSIELLPLKHYLFV